MTWLLRLLEQMSPQIVEAFKAGLARLLKEVYQKALATDNKWDDWGVEMMAKVFGVELDAEADPD